jgi:hypothetical protein
MKITKNVHANILSNLLPGGVIPRGQKLELYPTKLTHSTPVMCCKALRGVVGVEFVECVGVGDGLLPMCRPDQQ